MPVRPRLVVRWSTADPAALAARLGTYGFELGEDGEGRAMALPSAVVRISAGSGPRDALEVLAAEPRPTTARTRQPNGVVDVLAIGWATVDRERFVADLGPGAVEALQGDRHLGAFALRHGTGRPALLVLEPETEGLLSATLARSGEGPVAIYLGLGGRLARFVASAHARRAPISTVQDGPLGPSVALLGGPTWGPHVVVVERADRGRSSPGTIAP